MGLQLGFRVWVLSWLLRSYVDLPFDESRGLILSPAIGIQAGVWNGEFTEGVAVRVGGSYYWSRQNERDGLFRWNNYRMAGIEWGHSIPVADDIPAMPPHLMFTIGYLSH